MRESKQTRREVIDAELKKTKAELVIAKHREAKLRNQIKGMTEKERRHRNIVWGSHFEFRTTISGSAQTRKRAT